MKENNQPSIPELVSNEEGQFAGGFAELSTEEMSDALGGATTDGNGTCSGNGVCSGNDICSGNSKSCSNNETCIVVPIPEEKEL